jgi:hypothetical protein
MGGSIIIALLTERGWPTHEQDIALPGALHLILFSVCYKHLPLNQFQSKQPSFIHENPNQKRTHYYSH